MLQLSLVSGLPNFNISFILRKRSFSSFECRIFSLSWTFVSNLMAHPASVLELLCEIPPLFPEESSERFLCIDYKSHPMSLSCTWILCALPKGYILNYQSINLQLHSSQINISSHPLQNHSLVGREHCWVFFHHRKVFYFF